MLSGGVVDVMGITTALHLEPGLNMFTIAYDPSNTPLGEDIPLTPVGLPRVGAGFRVDPGTLRPRTAYVATSGAINFSTAVSDGATGSLTEVVLVEADATTGAPVASGCTLTVPSPATFFFAPPVSAAR
jgi:hypothetical protein